MTLQEIRTTVHNRLLRLRAIDRIVTSDTFRIALSRSTEDITPLLDSPDKLEAWIDKTLKVDLDDLTMGQLRVKATKLKIPFYTQYNKPNLILKILEAQDARKAKEVSAGVSSLEGGLSADNARVSGCQLLDTASQ